VLNFEALEINKEFQQNLKQFIEQIFRQLVRSLVDVRDTLLSQKLYKYRYIRKNSKLNFNV